MKPTADRPYLAYMPGTYWNLSVWSTQYFLLDDKEMNDIFDTEVLLSFNIFYFHLINHIGHLKMGEKLLKLVYREETAV